MHCLRAETRWQNVALFDLSWEGVHPGPQINLCSAHVCDDCKSAASIDLGVTNKFYQVSESANMESATSEDEL